MRLLLDSHTLIWAADAPAKLSARAQGLIHDPANDRLLSAATLWEVGIKFSLGRLPLALPYRQWMDRAIADLVLVRPADHARPRRAANPPAVALP